MAKKKKKAKKGKWDEVKQDFERGKKYEAMQNIVNKDFMQI